MPLVSNEGMNMPDTTKDYFEVTARVQVSISVTMAYDNGRVVSEADICRDALSNFLDHPALKTSVDLEAFGVDSIETTDPEQGHYVTGPHGYQVWKVETNA